LAFIDVCSIGGNSNWSQRSLAVMLLPICGSSPFGTEISQLKRLLAEKVQEVDLFKGVLQRIEARRRNSESTGATASTTKVREVMSTVKPEPERVLKSVICIGARIFPQCNTFLMTA
jgi:hypothetical protein